MAATAVAHYESNFYGSNWTLCQEQQIIAGI